MVPAVCSIELWVWGTRSHLQRPTVPVPKTKQEDTHISHSQAGGRNRGRKQGWHEEGKREVPTGGMNGTITLKNPEKRYCLSGSHPLLPLQYLCSQLIPSLYFPFPTSPLSAHPTAPSEPQLPHLRGFHCFTCCMICPGRAGTRMWVGDRGNLLVAAVVIVHIFHQWFSPFCKARALAFEQAPVTIFWQESATKCKWFNGSTRCLNQYFINYYYQCE